jgi:hypothetical protein
MDTKERAVTQLEMDISSPLRIWGRAEEYHEIYTQNEETKARTK